MRGLTQEKTAELVGTKQPSIARLESGASTPTVTGRTPLNRGGGHT
jgi:predicted transcriptional regulator